MMAPLNLIESNRPSPHDLVLLTQKLHWVFWIGQVDSERHDIIDNDISGWLQTFLQLRYVEHIVHTCQGWRQLQLVCHSSHFSQDGEWTDVAWCQLALDPESLHTSRRRDMKVHMVAIFKFKRPTSFVGIAFLSSPGSLQVGLDVVDYFLGLGDKVRAKDHPLARLDLVQGRTASTAIQSFEGCHYEALLITVVVRELSQWQTLVPFVLIVQHTGSEHILQNLVHSLRLTIGLQMIG
jgi:hypothetical protein